MRPHSILLILLLSVSGAVAQETADKTVFEEYDLDGDDVIDRIEFGMSSVAQRAREEGREEIIGERFDRLDLDKDNAVSRREFHSGLSPASDLEKAAAEAFAAADSNEDGDLNRFEFFQESGQKGKLGVDSEFFEVADRNGNDLVSRDEWIFASVKAQPDPDEEAVGDFARERFGKIDRNRDGRISLSEFERSDIGKRIKVRGGRDMAEIYFARLDDNRDQHLNLLELSDLPPVARRGPDGKGMKGPKGGKKGGGKQR